MIDNLNELVQWREVGKEVRVRHFVVHTFAAFESNETTILSGKRGGAERRLGFTRRPCLSANLILSIGRSDLTGWKHADSRPG